MSQGSFRNDSLPQKFVENVWGGNIVFHPIINFQDFSRVFSAWLKGTKPSVNSQNAATPLTQFLSEHLLPLLEWMELLNICHFSTPLRTPYTITDTQSLFSLISWPSQQQGIFPSAVASLEMLTQHQASSEIRKRKRILHDFSLAPAQPASSYSAVLCRCRQGSSSLSRRGPAGSPPLFLDGKLCRTVVDPLAPGHENPRVEERCRTFLLKRTFFKGTFPPLWTMCESNRGKNRDLYIFSDALGQEPLELSGDRVWRGLPQPYTFPRSVALKKLACGKVIFSPGI